MVLGSQTFTTDGIAPVANPYLPPFTFYDMQNTAIQFYSPETAAVESLTLKLKVKDVEDLDENWKANLPYLHACLQKLVLLGPAICLKYIIIHFVTGRMEGCIPGRRMNEHTAFQHTLFNSVGTVYKCFKKFRLTDPISQWL